MKFKKVLINSYLLDLYVLEISFVIINIKDI